MNSSNLEEIKCTAFAKALDVIKLDSILQYKHNPLNNQLEEIERKVESKVQADFQSKLSNFVQQELFEAKERDKKINNLVSSEDETDNNGVDTVDAEQNSNYLSNNVKQIREYKLEIQDFNVVEVKRIGARDPQQIRAVIVKFDSRNSSDTNL